MFGLNKNEGLLPAKLCLHTKVHICYLGLFERISEAVDANQVFRAPGLLLVDTEQRCVLLNYHTQMLVAYRGLNLPRVEGQKHCEPRKNQQQNHPPRCTGLIAKADQSQGEGRVNE
jgi:hypothetical protein